MALKISMTQLSAFQIARKRLVSSSVRICYATVPLQELGKNTNISCSKNSDNTVGNLQWYKEKKDGGLEAVFRSACHSPMRDNRFHVYCEGSSVRTVEIRNVNKSDSGVYYCSSSGLDQNFYIAGTLIVTEKNPTKPTLSILESVNDYQGDMKSAILMCVAVNWTKQWNSIKWTLNETEKDGVTTLDSDGILRSLLVMPAPIQYTGITCYIKEHNTGEPIFFNFTTESDDQTSGSDCYIVLYVGLPILISIPLIHQIILAFRRRTLSKDTPHPDTHQERRVRFRPEDESVTYAAVKS
ncbi:uncharacterized protein [Dendropsophus ebraccatus]|uniref:uncharacterized protein isoform X2 n=1 Tax=Dendropsophus ebraccatus TaxID=150705 RepID=UPI0038316112